MSGYTIKHFFTRNPWISPLTRKGLSLFNACMRRNFFQTRSQRVRTLKFLNIGCGKKMIDHTINLNYEWYPKIDLAWDVVKWKLPFQEGHLSGIYTEHVLEHLPPSSLPDVFKEWRRCLKPGGVLRVLVPDAELYLRTYCQIKDGGDEKFRTTWTMPRRWTTSIVSFGPSSISMLMILKRWQSSSVKLALLIFKNVDIKKGGSRSFFSILMNEKPSP